MGTRRRRSREEQAFLAHYDPDAFPRPSVAVDIVLLTVQQNRLRALLLPRDQYPDRDRWSLPGGFVRLDESLEACAQRVLREKAGLKRLFLEQLYTFGDPARDPRMRIITVAYYVLVPSSRIRLDERSTARLLELDVAWPGEAGGRVGVRDETGEVLPLAFDHAEILGMATLRLRGKLSYAPIGFELLPREFTLRQLQQIHETILGRSLNKDSFRRKMLASGMVVATGKREADVGHRPAELYRFSRQPA